MTLTYQAPAAELDITVGEPLGCDSTGWPYIVADVRGVDGRTQVDVEPWPLPRTEASDGEREAYRRAMTYAARGAGPIRD